MVKQISSVEFYTLFKKDPNYADTNLGKAVLQRTKEDEFCVRDLGAQPFTDPSTDL